MRAFLILMLLSLAGCASSGPKDAVLGRSISVLQAEEEMAPHVSYSFELGRYDYGQEWESFVSKLRPGDELRPYTHAASGKGYAIVRNGQIEDLYIWIVF